MGLEETQQELMEEIDREYAEELRKEENTVEALLFTMGGSVSMEEISRALDLSKDASQQAVERLLKRYEDMKTGLEIVKVQDKYQMRTRKEYFEPLIRVAKHPDKPVLTDVVMETLSIIAFKQPITKAEIEAIRGVRAEKALARLLEYELIAEVGRKQAIGRPILYGTTARFLQVFGLKSLEDLPSLPTDEEALAQLDVQQLSLIDRGRLPGN